MGDVIFVAVIIAFFALAAGLVRACDHIIGPEESVASEADQAARGGVAA